LKLTVVLLDESLRTMIHLLILVVWPAFLLFLLVLVHFIFILFVICVRCAGLGPGRQAIDCGDIEPFPAWAAEEGGKTTCPFTDA
jgi:hypothetical protein